jgi:surface protein
MPYHYPGGDWNVDLINNFVYVVDTRHSSTSDAVCRTHGGDATYPANINWGDGTIESRIDLRPRRRYNNHGIYTIQIIGVPGYFAQFGVGTAGESVDSFRQNLIKCLSYGRFITNLRSAFAGCTNLIEVPKIMRSNIVRVYGMFSNCINFDQDLSLYDLTGLVDDGFGFGLQSMFNGCTKFNNGGSPDIGKWNLSAVTSLSNTFNSCRNFNQDIGAWNTSNVTNMSNTFNTATSFNQSLNNWNVSKVTNMSSMFNGATAFNQDLSSWNLAGLNANTSLDNFMANKTGASSYSTVNYDALLIGWNNNKLLAANGVANWRTDLRPNFGGAKYTAGGAAATARAALVSYGWTITDGGTA